MDALLVSGSSNPRLASAVAALLGIELAACEIERFPDGELRAELRTPVRGRTPFLLQSLGPPVADHTLELLLLADACRRSGSGPMVAVAPYVGYARQDRTRREGQPLGAKVMAEVLSTGRFQQILAVELHSPVMASCADAPVAHLSAEPTLEEALRPFVQAESVIVSPDLGAVKLAESYARPLQLPMAIVHKTRISGTEVAAHDIVGEVRGKRPILVDDMISTGGTLEAAVDVLLARGCAPDVTLVATHGLFTEKAVQRLSRPEISRILVTDSLAGRPAPDRVQIASLAPLLAEAVRRISGGRPLDDLLAVR